ncbi:hypothetical protein [Actinomadura rupiterrae]|uniref:hypothetical protein n=1 Tax=Actinomadura rupiterrae TaxID=559627 RepID=UPI0020A391BE|nr:hypothetical protein [Actinomadura rupiterrae]MCP2342031.1 hypothetical protein [Actinomadura rupiterrae]
MDGFRLLGFDWSPVPFGESSLTIESGLYAWVDGRGIAMDSASPEPPEDPLDRGVLYWGIGKGNEGVLGRLHDEVKWVTDDATHGHGMAMHARLASPVVGPVSRDDGYDISWIDQLLTEHGAQQVRLWLGDASLGVVQKAEQLAIRLVLHLGDVGAPVQSLFSGAWANDHAADWAAWGISQRLRSCRFEGVDTAQSLTQNDSSPTTTCVLRSKSLG